MSSPADQANISPRVRGRRVAMVVYYGIVAAVCVVCAVQVTQQVLFVPERPTSGVDCPGGLRKLFGAILRAREAAEVSNSGEDDALARFRKALEPEWTLRDEIANSCRHFPKHQGTLDAIERLRYAEEHAVRREAGELAPLRRRVQAIVDGELRPKDPVAPRPQ